jgi:hypothetical protein
MKEYITIYESGVLPSTSDMQESNASAVKFENFIGL